MQPRRKYLTKYTCATDSVLFLTFWQRSHRLEIVDRLICLREGGTREMSCLAAGWKKTPVSGTLCPQLHIWSIFFGGPRFATISTCLQQKEDKPRFTNQKLFIFIFLNFLLCNSLGSFIFWSRSSKDFALNLIEDFHKQWPWDYIWCWWSKATCGEIQTLFPSLCLPILHTCGL